MKYLIVILLIIGFTSCYKYEDAVHLSLPAKTQNGANTLGFMLQNEVWQNYGQTCNIGGCPANLQGWYFRSDRSVSISAYKVIRIKEQPVTYENFDFSFFARPIAPGVYRAGDSVGVSYSFGKEQEEKHYQSLLSQPAFTVTITRLDTIANIISGEFSGKLFLQYIQNGSTITTGNTDSVVITEGRFDVKLK